ncbi:MAG: 30S ribosomal protein S3 [Christensenellaceae bacterium]|nr:30S ribosomal protein S3 [Christensenellaceae bacterium]
MGQKVNPNGFRVGVIRDWNTRWYANKKDFANYLVEDKKIRDFLKNKYYETGIAKIDIERAANKVTVSIHTARPGMLIGKGGVGVDAIKAELNALTKRPVNVNIMEVRSPDANAQLVAENIATALEKRTSFRRAMKQSLSRAIKAGAKGIKVKCSGRLGGAEIARTEGYNEGSTPLQTIRADIEYGFAEAKTTYGRIGVKVWIYRGEVLNRSKARKA